MSDPVSPRGAHPDRPGPGKGRGALVSVHDVMPETLDRVAGLLELLGRRGIAPATLLVVPGRDWDARGLARLRAWARAGHELAAHGWSHRAPRLRSARARAHARVISRHAGEHLDRGSREIRALIQRSHGFFAANGLPRPALYVPPAWALGALRPADRVGLPVRRIETLAGLLELDTGRLRPLPLVGFEADTAARAATLRAANGAQRALARATGRPLRVAIHPHDRRLRLSADLDRLLAEPLRPLAYAEA